MREILSANQLLPGQKDTLDFQTMQTVKLILCLQLTHLDNYRIDGLNNRIHRIHVLPRYKNVIHRSSSRTSNRRKGKVKK